MEKLIVRRFDDPRLADADREAVARLQHTRSSFHLNRFGRVYHITANGMFADTDVPCLFRFEKLVSFVLGDSINASTRFSDDGIREIVSNPTIARLLFQNCPNITDNALPAIANNNWIRWLGLNCRNITDDGMSILPRMSHLINFGLYNSRVSEKSLSYLTTLSRLRYLFLNGGNFSAEALRRLQLALPNCLIKLV